ncbi:hypothetical protein [Massilia sp. CT11-137]|uniref:hypothetical protein n=2 Tax=unclassified Massilia TaxID=2609279 RepID=UPI0039B0586B
MYKQTSPADGWHFVSKDEVSGKPIVFPLAAWAVVDDGSAVIGLVGDVLGGGPRRESSSYNSMARLIGVPPIEGAYKHVNGMTMAELAAVKSNDSSEN